MKTRFILCLLFLSSFLWGHAQDSTRVLIIALDGICTDGLKKANTPNIDKLMSEGAYSFDTRNVIPSVTLPNWTSILCGSGPERHGVINNSWTINNVQLKAVERNENGYYPSIFQALKENVSNVKTAFYYNWKELINAFDPTYMDEKIFLEDDQFIPNYEKAYQFMCDHRNEPTFVFLYDVHTDHAGHSSGWMSDPYIKAIEEADQQIGVLFEKMKKAQLYENTYILFVTDHGGINHGHGGYTQEEMSIPWSVTGKDIKPGMIKEQNFTVNTASMIARFFNIQQPTVWSGNILESVFDKPNPSVIISEDLENAVYYTIKNEHTGKFMSVNKEGQLVQSDTESESTLWFFKKSGEGFLLINKTASDLAIGDENEDLSLVGQDKGSVWYLCKHPEVDGMYCISQEPDASKNCLNATENEDISYWMPTAFNQQGLFWVLSSDDPRTQIDEKRNQLKENIEKARKALQTIENKMSDQIVGSYTPDAVNLLTASIEEAQKKAEDMSLTVEQIEESIQKLSQDLDQAYDMPKLDFVNGAVYQIMNADSRFKGLVYLYVDQNNTLRWGIKKDGMHDYYRWKVTVKDGKYVLYNMGAKKYLGSCAWDAARPENVLAVDQEIEYELDNSLAMDEPRDWTMRSVDSHEAENPEKSYIACTGDNSSNLTDGLIRPWNPTDAAANHDAFWRFILEDTSAKEELQNGIEGATSYLNFMTKNSDVRIVGSFTAEAITLFSQAIEQAQETAGNPNATDQQIEQATSDLEKALLAAKNSVKVDFEENATYQIKNADSRFQDLVYLYVNSDNTLRWGVVQKDIEENYDWIIEKKGENIILKNKGTNLYASSSAWDDARPENVLATEQSMEYQIKNTLQADVPYEWALRSADSEQAANPNKSYLACTDDNSSNLTDGRIRPWNPTDATAKHDGYWIFIKKSPTVSINEVNAMDEKIQVINKRIYVDNTDVFSIHTLEGKSIPSDQTLSPGVYVVSYENKSCKVIVK